jgi:hypothetical protein
MGIPNLDERSSDRRLRDESIAAEPHLPPPEIPTNAVPTSMEAQLGRLRRQPIAIAGLVENGVIRPLDPTVKLPEFARVIIVAEST